MNRIIVTGGAGFIGSALVRWLIRETGDTVCVLDKLTYAGNPDALAEVAADPRYNFVKMDICDRAGVRKLFANFKPTHIMHLAAESHVDRSIASGEEFIRTNIDGTFNLLEAAREYGKLVMFHHISTDEVYGDLKEGAFTEESPVRPSSPYSASKAAADHLVRAWYRTYGLPTIVTNCSNNFGPWQHPEKLIPHIIHHAVTGQSLPIYGNGCQVRDWLYVEDHVRALYLAVTRGKAGSTYNIGANCEYRNIDLVKKICGILDELKPRPDGKSYTEQIEFVADRPGHDVRYAINAGKIRKDLHWLPEFDFETALRKTVIWYLNKGSF